MIRMSTGGGSRYAGVATNQCERCGARYPATEEACSFHSDIDLWLRGSLVRVAVVAHPQEPRAGISTMWVEIVRFAVIESQDPHPFGGWGALGLAEEEERAIEEAFWDQEEYPDRCQAWYWRDSSMGQCSLEDIFSHRPVGQLRSVSELADWAGEDGRLEDGTYDKVWDLS